jgi:predicted acylesterase/phospholipase RssA
MSNLDTDISYGIIIDPTIKSGENTIRHLVISGGAITGLTYYGALRELNKKNYWKLENIKTIFGTSVGSLIAVVIALGYEWSDTDDYFIKRPWQNVFKITTLSMIDSIINKMGIYNSKVYEESFAPLFAGKDLSINITLKEFYELNGIELHMYTTELNTFKLIDISYKTHPDWRVVDAVYCSCSLPFIFIPFSYEKCIYCDGGMFSNYPLEKCIESGAELKEILGIYRVYSDEGFELTSESTIFDYLMTIMNHTIEKIIMSPKIDKVSIGIECIMPGTSMSLSSMHNIISNADARKQVIDIGCGYEF